VNGSADGTGAAARFIGPAGVAVDGAGNVYVADQYNHTIRKITAAGVVTTLAGSAGLSGASDESLAQSSARSTAIHPSRHHPGRRCRQKMMLPHWLGVPAPPQD
jgi:DNA-binding beta-propeller fold protein YncE